MAAQECSELLQIIRDTCMNENCSVELNCDSQSSIRLASNPVFMPRLSILVFINTVRGKVFNEEIDLAPINTEEQVTYIVTKSLPVSKLNNFCHLLGVCSRLLALKGYVED